MVRSDVFFCCLSKMSIKCLFVLTNGNIVKRKYLLGKIQVTEQKVGVMRGKPICLFVTLEGCELIVEN